jgi:hypothetical protein
MIYVSKASTPTPDFFAERKGGNRQRPRAFVKKVGRKFSEPKKVKTSTRSALSLQKPNTRYSLNPINDYSFMSARQCMK